MKKITTLMVFVVCAITLRCNGYIDTNSTEQDGIRWDWIWMEDLAGGGAVIMGHGDLEGRVDLRIPSKITEFYAEYPVVAIGDMAFDVSGSLALWATTEGNSNLRTVTVPQTVQVLGRQAFWGCDGLRKVEIEGSNLVSIGTSCFALCENLEEMILPPSVEAIGGDAFRGCPKLGLMELPPKLTAIADGTFRGCSGLDIKAFPFGVESIGANAFLGCALTSAILPEGVTELGEHVFSSCSDLAVAKIPSGVRNIPAYAFYNCINLKTLDIEEGVEEISASAFAGCSSITRLDLPTTVKTIGSKAFYGCNMQELVLPASLESVSDAFENCTNLTSLTIMSSQLSGGAECAGDLIFSGKNADLKGMLKRFSGNRIIVAGDVGRIPESAFRGVGCSAVKVSSGVTEIGDYAFEGCSAREIIIEGAVKLGKGVFRGCKQLRRVVVNDKVSEFPDETFYGCESLEDVNWPMQLSVIGDEAFYACALTNLNLSQTQVCTIGKEAFFWCRSLWSPVVFPATLTFIDDEAFAFTQIEYDPVSGTKPTEARVNFLGAPPVVGDNVFDFTIYTVNRSQCGTFVIDFASEWCSEIAKWSKEHNAICQWADLNFKLCVDAAPVGWKILDSNGGQELNVAWHLPTNENYTIEQAARDLQGMNLKYAIWRSSMDPDDRYDDWSHATNIIKHYRGDLDGGSFSNYLDKTFGAIKGTAPVKYWIEIEDPDDEENMRCIKDITQFDYRQLVYGRIPPAEEPSASFVTRRRFGLAVGLSAYDKSAYGEHVSPGLVSCERDTDEFVRQLRSSGGVEHDEDVKVLKNSEAIYDRIGQYVREMPFENGKERFVPGDIVFLWMATHGVNIGGIDAYDGYYLSGRDERWELNSSVGRCATFPDDLSWIRERPGVRLIGILPFCHAEWFAKEFDGLPNVAWICAAKTNEEAANTTRGTSQFNQYFLNFGVSKGLACWPQVKGSPYQEMQSFEICKAIGDGNDVLTCGELARYGEALAFGCSNTKASHAVLVNEPVLDSVIVKENVKPVAGSAPERVKLMMRQDESGAIRVYFSIPKSQTDIILWHRKKDSGGWQWSSVYTSDIMKSLDLKDKLTTVIWSWQWNDPDLFPKMFHAYVLFGAHTSSECSRLGWVEPDTEYEFAIQCVNEYGFGAVRNGGFFKTGKDLPTPPREVFIEHFNEAVHYQGVFSGANGSASGGASVDVSPDDGGWMVTARLSFQGEKVCYSGFVADLAVDDDGYMDVKLTKSAEDVHMVQTTLKAMGSAGSSAAYPDELSLKIGVTGVSGISDGIDIACIPVDEVDLEEDASDVACPGVQVQVDPPVSSLLGEVSYSAKSLPKGLSIDSSTGVISGTPTVPGSYVVLVTVKSKTDPTQVETIEVPIVIGNYVDETIAVDDEYGPFVPGEKVELKFADGAAWKVTGLPTGLKWDAKLPGVTGVPTKPGSNTVYFTWTDKTVTPNVTHKASSTFIVGPLPKASVQIDGKGKVTGAGAHLANKKVTLKATAGKGYAFAGWYLGGELVTKSASYSFKATGEDADYRARFVTLAEDKASIGATVNGMAFSSTSGQETASPLATNAMCGVALFWPLSHEALSATSVKVTGLPKGLKYDTKKKAITGTPTAPGKTSSVKIAVTTAGKQKSTFVLKVTVDPLPEWARGQFSGTVVVSPSRSGEDTASPLTMTVGSTGKVSGKFKDGITNWTFSASSFATNSVTVGDTNLFCRATAKGTYKNAKKKTVTVSAPIAFELVARPDVSPIAAEGLGDFADGTDNVKIRRLAGVRISVGETGGGTVKMDKSYGQVAAGGKVKLTATVKKGYAFLGWYDLMTGDTEPVSQATTYALVSDGEADRFLEARFVKETELSANDITLEWNAPTDIFVGVSYSAKPTVRGRAAVKIASVTGLPKGLSWKSGKVSGVPTKAQACTVKVRVALTTNSKKYWDLKVPIEVRALPEWTTGTFNGGAPFGASLASGQESASPSNQVSVTVTAAGKVSGKLNDASGTWTLSASSLAAYVPATENDGLDAFTAKATGKNGRKSRTFEITLTGDGIVGFLTSGQETASPFFAAWRNVWKTELVELAKELDLREDLPVGGDLILKFGANGAVTGVLTVGKDTFTCTTTLVPEEDGYRAYLSFAPNSKKKFKGEVRVVEGI